MTQTARYTGQIAVHKTPARLLEFIDNLNQAPTTEYASIHAGSTRPHEVGGRRVYSNIRLVAQDYSRKGEPSTRVTANISPIAALFIAEAASSNRDSFLFESTKIFGTPDEKGYSPMAKLWITRESTTKDGEVLRRPWKIDIENGKGVKHTSENGGTSCERGTYVQEKKVALLFTDFEFYELLTAVKRFIKLWEALYGANLIKEGRNEREMSRVAYQNNKTIDEQNIWEE